ncbi:MAG: U32 family peptidase, partial [Eubacteriales bacterium]|nr:U32 family peptidase [Eubacteriales bacterium]
MELLSPAGSMDCLISAVQNGADAVYFGGGSFNARRYADNFEGDELTRAVDYCHERGVRCYITLNTLLFEREIPSALDFAAELYRIGADAVLVQDLGLASLLRKYLPELTLHASTQMGIHDLGGLQYCKRTGITRAVLAREVGLDMIEYLAKNGGIEIETFAHGALCMSFSGSCLYSSMAGERSGNRGTCAQPCRKRASVSGRPGRHDYCLSPNDICMLSELDKLKKAGVSCVKIEGRMKKPEYVATVTRCYRAALDGADAREIEKMRGELFELFNRGSFSTSHLYGDSVRTDREASSKPGRELVRLAENSVKNENRKTPISFELELAAGSEAKLTAQCKGNTVAVRGAEVQKAQKPQTEQGYIDRLSKLGDTPFVLNSCRVDM